MESKGGKQRRVKTCDTTFDIIDIIMEFNGSNIPEIADTLDLARSTVHDHLTTLEDRGLLVKDGRDYDLSLKFFQYGNYAVRNRDIIPVAQDGLERIAEETEETVWLTVEEHGEYINVAMAQGSQGIQTKGVLGGRYPLHAGAVGKTFLAHYPEERVHEILENGLNPITDNTITDEDEFFAELERIREKEIAFSDGEITDGVRGIAAPIVTDEIVAAILVSGPKNRLQGEFFEEVLPQLLRGVTNSIELELQYQ